eukprot:218908_1
MSSLLDPLNLKQRQDVLYSNYFDEHGYSRLKGYDTLRYAQNWDRNIERELHKINTELKNINVTLAYNNIRRWNVIIKASNQPYKNAEFLVRINLQKWPFQKPNTNFITDIYHCNVSPGPAINWPADPNATIYNEEDELWYCQYPRFPVNNPCGVTVINDIDTTEWNELIKLFDIVLCLKLLVDNPNLNHAHDPEMVYEYINYRWLYNTKANMVSVKYARGIPLDASHYIEALYRVRKLYYSQQMDDVGSYIMSGVMLENDILAYVKRFMKESLKMNVKHCGNYAICKTSIYIDENNQNKRNRKCSGCQSIYYCNKSCQKKHWKLGHRVECAFS